MIFYSKRQFINFFQIFILCAYAQIACAQERPEPEAATNTVQKQSTSAKSYMAVTANPLATQAAEKILAAGGGAADAAIAAQLVLGLVEPQSSGLGGGAFVLYYDAESGELSSYDARETAPELAWPEMFLTEKNEPMEFYDAVIGGRSVGVPGTPALLHKLYKDHGKAPAADVFAPAIQLAEQGFAISPRLAAMIEHDQGKLDLYDTAKSYFFDEEGKPKAGGMVLKNPEYAEVLKRFETQGRDYFYSDLAKDIATIVQDAGGYLSEHDFAAYDVVMRDPVCGMYRGYKICGMGEPSSGGLTVLQILGMLEPFDLTGGASPRNIHLIAEASRLAFADRNQYMADPDFVETPATALIAPEYLTERSALINEDRRMDKVIAGKPDLEGGTSHITIVDAAGNIVSMTTTIEGAFGSKLMAHGFMLNNELTDFNFKPNTANSPEGRKRPRSSMAPTIVFDPEGKPFMALGSAGGSRIIGFVAQRIIAVIDWNMNLQEALAMPHFLARSDTVELEGDFDGMAAKLATYGHETKAGEMSSGLTAVMFKDGTVIGAADPRREGVALGQ